MPQNGTRRPSPRTNVRPWAACPPKKRESCSSWALDRGPGKHPPRDPRATPARNSSRFRHRDRGNLCAEVPGRTATLDNRSIGQILPDYAPQTSGNWPLLAKSIGQYTPSMVDIARDHRPPSSRSSKIENWRPKPPCKLQPNPFGFIPDPPLPYPPVAYSPP